MKTILTAGQKFVRVALMSHVPKQPVGGKIKYPVQGDGQFSHAQITGEMSATGADHFNDALANFGCEIIKLTFGQRPQIHRRSDFFEKAHRAHSTPQVHPPTIQNLHDIW